MKIRTGFVSNSSSSSFIVAFPKDFEITKDSVKDYLFGDQEVLACYGDGITTERAAETIANDMKEQVPNSDEAIDSALGGYLVGAPSYDAFFERRKNLDLKKPEDKAKWDKAWEEYNKASTEFRNMVKAEFMAEHSNFNLFVFEYSDNDGNYYSTLEHGGTFDAVPHLAISNH
jgi:hypothetical protein